MGSPDTRKVSKMANIDFENLDPAAVIYIGKLRAEAARSRRARIAANARADRLQDELDALRGAK